MLSLSPEPLRPSGVCGVPLEAQNKIKGGSCSESPSSASVTPTRSWSRLHLPISGHTRHAEPTFPVTMELGVEPEQLRQLKVINIS